MPTSYLSIGDRVRIEDVESGSRDVIGMTGTITAIEGIPEKFVVETPFTARVSVDVIATQVAPA